MCWDAEKFYLKKKKKAAIFVLQNAGFKSHWHSDNQEYLFHILVRCQQWNSGTVGSTCRLTAPGSYFDPMCGILYAFPEDFPWILLFSSTYQNMPESEFTTLNCLRCARVWKCVHGALWLTVIIYIFKSLFKSSDPRTGSGSTSGHFLKAANDYAFDLYGVTYPEVYQYQLQTVFTFMLSWSCSNITWWLF